MRYGSREVCKHVDLYLMGDDRYDHLTLRTANKKAQMKEALDAMDSTGSSALCAQLAIIDGRCPTA